MDGRRGSRPGIVSGQIERHYGAKSFFNIRNARRSVAASLTCLFRFASLCFSVGVGVVCRFRRVQFAFTGRADERS